MSKGNKDLLKHIVGYCNQIDEAHAQFGNSYEAFCNNSVYRNAVAMCVLQIGELANHLTEEFREATAQDIPWKQIRGLRNVVAHEYGNIDEESLWETKHDTERYDDRVNLYSMPFYDSEQYSDIVFTNNSVVKASCLIISRGLSETYIEDDTVVQFRRIKYWIKVQIDNRVGYLPFDVLDYDIGQHISELNAKTSDIKRGFYGWYYPIPDSVGVYRPMPRFVQSSWGPCAVLSMMMSLYNINSSGFSAKEYYDFYYVKSKYRDEYDKGPYHSKDFTVFGNSKNYSSEEYISASNLLNTLRKYMTQGTVAIIGANSVPFEERTITESKYNNHYSIVVGYINNGEHQNDFIFIDTMYYIDFPCRLDDFLSLYPYGAKQCVRRFL